MQKNTKKSYRLILHIIVLLGYLVFLIPLNAQDKKIVVVEAKNKEPLPLTKIVKRDGWDIPEVDENQFDSSNVQTVDGISVTSKNYKFRKNVILPFDYFFLNADNSLITFTKEVEVNRIFSFVANGKVFAYGVVGSPFGYTKEGSRALIAVLHRAYYFDEDGDGKFETKYQTNQFPNKLPNWVTSNNK